MVVVRTIVLSILIVTATLFSAEADVVTKSRLKEKRADIAVFDLYTTFKSDNEAASIISDRIRTELIKTGIVSVLEENEMKELLSRQKFQYTDSCYSATCIADAGHLIGVDRVVYGSVAKVNDSFTVVLRLLNVPRGEIVYTIKENTEGDSKKGFSEKIQSLVQNLMIQGGYTIPETAEKEGTGVLHIDAQKAGAVIVIDGKEYKEKAPVTFNKFPAGKHRIVIKDKEWYGVKEINLGTNDTLMAVVPLCNKKEKVFISSSPAKAMVIIDGKEYGETPLTTSLWIGSHQVQVKKDNYFTGELIITVDSTHSNNVQVNLKAAAKVSVTAKPDYSSIYVNGKYEGKGSVNDHTVEAGDVEIQIEATEYALYKTTEKIPAGEEKTVTRELDYLFGSLKVTSKPEKVSLFLNDVEIGTTPYANHRLRTGTYTLKLLEDTYDDVTEDIVINPNEFLKKEYALEHTEMYRDSLRRERWIAHGARGLRRVLFCAIGAACGAAGYYFDTEVKKHKDNYEYWYAEYEKIDVPNQAKIDHTKEMVSQEKDRAETNASRRNLLYGAAGVFGVGFFISIFF